MYKILILSLFFFLPLTAFADYTIQPSSATNNIDAFGDSLGDITYAQQFTTVGAGDISAGTVLVRHDGAVSDHITCSIYADSAGSPSGSALGTSNNLDAPSTSFTVENVVFSTPIGVTSATTYWLACTRTGSFNGSAFYLYGGEASATIPPSKTCAVGPLSCSSDKKTANISLFVVESSVPTTTSATTTIVDNPVQDTFYGFILFIVGMCFPIWFFSKKRS